MGRRQFSASNAVLGILSLALVVLMLASSLSAASTTTVNGTINTIDLAKRTINLKLADGSRVTLKAPGTAAITRNGSKTSLNGLTLRDTAAVKYTTATQNILSLKSTGPVVSKSNGTVKNVRDTMGTVTVGTKKFKTNAKTKIARRGLVIPLGRLTRHDTVVVHARPNTTLANDILSCGPEESEMEGTILAIDLEAGTITVSPDNDTADMTFTVDGSTIIELDGVAVSLSALQVEMKVEVGYNPETLLAYSIEAESEDNEACIQGTVSAVDVNAGTITIQPSWDNIQQCWDLVTLSVTADTEIIVNGLAATLADVQVGMPVEAVYDESTMVAKRVEAGEDDETEEGEAEIEGSVSELGENYIVINANAGVLNCNGEPVTLTVDGSTEIEINGETGLFTDIQVGDWAWAKYDQETLLAKKIKIESGCDEASPQAASPRKKK